MPSAVEKVIAGDVRSVARLIRDIDDGMPQVRETLKALHPHTVDVMRYYCGDVEAVQCFALKAPGRAIWSTAQFNMRFVNGVVGSLTGSYDIERGHPMERCEVAGTGGRFVVDDMWREATLYPAGDMEKVVYTNPVFGGYRDFVDTFRARLHRFVEQVDEGADPDEIEIGMPVRLEFRRISSDGEAGLLFYGHKAVPKL